MEPLGLIWQALHFPTAFTNRAQISRCHFCFQAELSRVPTQTYVVMMWRLLQTRQGINTQRSESLPRYGIWRMNWTKANRKCMRFSTKNREVGSRSEPCVIDRTVFCGKNYIPADSSQQRIYRFKWNASRLVKLVNFILCHVWGPAVQTRAREYDLLSIIKFKFATLSLAPGEREVDRQLWVGTDAEEVRRTDAQLLRDCGQVGIHRISHDWARHSG